MSYEFPVERGHVLAFARAIGDPEADSQLTTNADALYPPLTFTKGSAQFDPEYPLRPRPGQPWNGSGKGPTGTPEVERKATGLLAEQSFEYHRPIRVGEVLHVEDRPGKTWRKHGRKGGELEFRELITEFRDAEGELVVTAIRLTVEASQLGQRGAEQ